MEEVVHGVFNFNILGDQFVSLGLDVVFLHLDEAVQAHRLVSLGELDERLFAHLFKVVFNSIFNDVIDVDDQLLKLLEAVVDVLQIGIDVHGGPGESDHSGSEFEFEVLDVGVEEELHDGLHFSDDSLVFFEHIEEFIVVGLEFFLLEKDDSSAFGDFDTHSVHGLGLSDQLHDFEVEVDIKLVVFLVSHDEGRLEGGLGLLDFVAPVLVVPHLIDGELLSQGVVGTVVFLDLRGVDDVLREHVDGAGDLLEQVSGPDDLSSFGRHVTDDGGVRLLIGEYSLDVIKLSGVIVQDGVVLGGEVVLQGVPFKRALEFSQKLEGVFNVSESIEIVVDVSLELHIEVRDLHVELDVISVELIVLVIKEVMSLFFKLLDDFVKFLGELLHSLEIVSGEGLELFNGIENFDEFHDPSTEEIESSENLGLAEVESLSFGHVSHLILGLLVTVLVLLVESDAAPEDFYQLQRVLLPNEVGLLVVSHNSELAVGDHLVRDLHEQPCHLVSSVVESGDGVDHFNRVHQRGQRVDDLLGGSVVQRVDEFLKSGQIFHIVLGFVQLVSQLEIKSVVVDHQLGNGFVATSSSSVRQGVLALVFEQVGLHKLEVLRFKLFRPLIDLLHSGSPEFEFESWACVSGLALGVGVVIQQAVKTIEPLSEFLLEEVDLLLITVGASVALHFFRRQSEDFFSR